MKLTLDLQTIVLLIVAAMNMITMYYTRKTEKNTNSMKDALVEATAKVSHAEGREEGRELEEKRADNVAASSKPALPVEVVNPTPVPVEVVVKESPKEK